MFEKKIKNKNNSGFTIIEVLVSTALIAVLSAGFVVNFKKMRSQGELQRATDQMVNAIRTVQNYSMNAKVDTASTAGLAISPNVVPLGGWGIYLTSSGGDKNKIKIFSDILEDSNMQNNEEFSEIILSGSVYVKEINTLLIGGTSATPNKLIAIYKPPKPTIIMGRNAGAVRYSEAIIELQNDDGDSVTITINNVGLININ